MTRAKSGDTRVQNTLRRGGAVIDLTGAAVEYHLKLRADPATVVSGNCTVPAPATAGAVHYPVPPVGRYDAEWEITHADGRIETVPNGPPEVLVVTPEIA